MIKNKVTNSYQIRTTRTFSEEFKKRKVEEILTKTSRISDISREYQVSLQSIYRWIYRYSTMKKKSKLIVESESDTRKLEELRRKIAELEQALGQKQIQNDFLNKMIDIAEDTYQIDIKKKFGGKL
jgi:transposase-like protein